MDRDILEMMLNAVLGVIGTIVFLLLIATPFAIWKLVDIVYWLFS